ncbi:tubulin polyglutamylase ttll6-like isoform X2 [Octopus sinensis]|uniref:Tubulin polyglutamylase ttll6-like isoform X2 n=1 Tax=Octopus sinensis TaxID=2607531 RepID=A0A6P7U038_9MOLL|nr:tubulin polyglutamylase ttll6-like isoform X2 [Octopus sinensis]
MAENYDNEDRLSAEASSCNSNCSEAGGSDHSDSLTESEAEDDADIDNLNTADNEEMLTLIDDDIPYLKPIKNEFPGEIEVSVGEEEEEYFGEDDSKDFITSNKKTSTKKKKKRRKKKWLSVSLASCKYEVVRRMTKKFGFKEVGENDDWILYWTDYSVALERVMDMKSYQKINHFPGMNEICRKDLLARNMTRMRKMFPKDYDIFPKTWCLPADYGDFQAFVRQKKNKTYILKPESGCQGKGIWVTKSIKDIKANEHMICQLYISKPFLIDGFKFDFRIYVLLTSCDPLRIFVFKDGLTRFATCRYCEPNTSNIDNVYMHLTNYSINKHSEDFVRDDNAGSKRRISTVNKYMRDHGYDVDKLWRDIDDVIVKTIISAHAVLRHNYRTCFQNHTKTSACFEILGIDVMLDKKLKPLIIEVNHSPSFNVDSALDKEIKSTLVGDTLALLNFGASNRRKCTEEERKRVKDRLLGRNVKKETKEEQEQAHEKYLESLDNYETTHLGNFRRIYPSEVSKKYDQFFQSSSSLFQETIAFKARSELVRQQREDLLKKQNENNEYITKIKKKDTNLNLRPESPMPKKQSKKHTGPYANKRKICALHKRKSMTKEEKFDVGYDSSKPDEIRDDEELIRVSALVQRDTLVRGLGVANIVYRLLNIHRNSETSPSHERHDKQLVVQVKPPVPLTSGSSSSSLVHCNNYQFTRSGEMHQITTSIHPGTTNLFINNFGNFSSTSTMPNEDQQVAVANNCNTFYSCHAKPRQHYFNMFGTVNKIVGGNKRVPATYNQLPRGYSTENPDLPSTFVVKESGKQFQYANRQLESYFHPTFSKPSTNKDLPKFSTSWSHSLMITSAPAPLIYKCSMLHTKPRHKQILAKKSKVTHGLYSAMRSYKRTTTPP